MLGYWLFTKKEDRSFCLVFDRKKAEELAKKNHCYIEVVLVD